MIEIKNQEYTCPCCYVKTTGLFESEIDREMVMKNIEQELKYKEESEIYIQKLAQYHEKEKEYRKIVDIHNECSYKHCSLFNKPDIWNLVILTSYNLRGKMYIKGTGCYPVIYEPEKPYHISNYLTQYIECPVCGDRYYFK